MKLLIAVKSEIIADAIAASLSMHEVHTCNTGTDALAMLEAHRPDALILDLILPGTDGLTVLQKTGFRPHRILALTTLVTPAVLQAAADAGVQNILILPCTVPHIIAQLNALTEKAPSTEG